MPASMPGTACTVRSSVATMLQPSLSIRCLSSVVRYLALPVRRRSLLPGSAEARLLAEKVCAQLYRSPPHRCGAIRSRLFVQDTRLEFDRFDFEPVVRVRR